MATIVSETNLVTRGECQETHKNVSDQLNEIKDILRKLPKQILDEANNTYVRKDIYDLNMRAMVEEMKNVRTNTENLQKNDDSERKDNFERMFKLLQMAVNIIVIIGMAYIATK